MALYGNNDFKTNVIEFKDVYKMSIEEFINIYENDKIEIDLTEQIVVSVRSAGLKNIPVEILGLYIPENEKYNHTSKLIYAGHIAFIHLNYHNGNQVYLYKDDECEPQSFNELIENESDILYEWVDERGGVNKDIPANIEKYIQIMHDVDFKLDINKLILLEGL